MRGQYDVIVVGAGPAGLSAALYAARAKYRVLVLEKEKLGGQITITSEIVNYPGVEKTNGTELTEQMRRQAEAFGAEFAMAEVTGIDLDGDIRTVKTDKGEYRAPGIVLAVGANPRKLGFVGEREYQGRGVAYCATCDGEFFTGMDVFVIGGGFAAAEEAVFLTKYAKKVTIIVREEDFTCAKAVADKAKNHEKIEVHYETEIVEAAGDGLLRRAHFKDNASGGEWTYEAPEGTSFGIFVFAGYVPDTRWLEGFVELDGQGYIITDRNQKTSVDGIYAAGDVCVKNLRQVVTAVSDGAVAATSLERYVSETYEKPELAQWKAQMEEERTKAVENSGASKHTGAAENSGTLEASDGGTEGVFITGEMKSQLADLFSRLQNRIVVEGVLDGSPMAAEMEHFLDELGDSSDMVECRYRRESDKIKEDEEYPVLRILTENGNETGIRFYAVPGGHEFNSFVLAIYNAGGPGQPITDEERERIGKLKGPVNIKIAVSLSCTMCPATVMAAGRIAAERDGVEAWAFDLAHYPEMKEKYQIMSVPCTIINDRTVVFGRKTVDDLLAVLEES
ncbi:MAG: FAD-dependent oxidoreductase [Clostridiales bacterium]|uniref:FAD-dependent oxidoreductase n=1 Tax=Hungatella hathewayi TaxID=154046 RepID=UPI00210A918E|nr:FAD-dependent oxidoreductase [Hungatella hathewayi]MCD7966047.1 FAD-dependent oxidoreductase [Clostridiaceae bacterium]MCD7997567.1 FAD-dependent oxidoreductase [Clostridiales bacterium]MCQ5383942.1 FAD-dependent oxidoreductase [Hungatella hathewayi]